MLLNLCDTHVHTLFSRHAYSTVEEDVRAAAERGLELVGITDHFSTMIATPPLHPIDYQHFMNMRMYPREWMGVRVLRGAEADITDLDGRLFGYDLVFRTFAEGDVWRSERTLAEQAFRWCDYVIASVHGRDFTNGTSPAALTNMYIAALEHPKVLMLGHIGRTGLPCEYAAIVRAAAELGKVLEINEHSFWWQRPETNARCRALAEACAEAGVMIAVNTDAHISYDVGRFEHALAMLEEIHFPEELIATRSADAFVGAVERAIGPLER